jgi:hypothetical protein
LLADQKTLVESTAMPPNFESKQEHVRSAVDWPPDFGTERTVVTLDGPGP